MINYFNDEALQELINQIKDRDKNVKDFAGDLTDKVDKDGNPYTSVQKYLEDLITGVGSSGAGVDSSMLGDLSALTTTSKENLVSAINEINSNVNAIVIPDTDDFLKEEDFNELTSAKILELFGDDNSPSLVELTLGETYQLGGYDWVCAEEIDGGYALQSCGVTSGPWPGYKMAKWGNGNYYSSSIDGQDISDYDSKMLILYNSIKSAERLIQSYGLGLYLVSNAKCGTTTDVGDVGAGYYYNALLYATQNYSSFGADYSTAWLGTFSSNYYAWYINQSGNVYNYNQNFNHVIAPAFNIDASKIKLNGTEIIVK